MKQISEPKAPHSQADLSSRRELNLKSSVPVQHDERPMHEIERIAELTDPHEERVRAERPDP
jgi:hypothetical protein